MKRFRPGARGPKRTPGDGPSPGPLVPEGGVPDGAVARPGGHEQPRAVPAEWFGDARLLDSLAQDY
eukprot:9081408-Alexandrium_andersonii.AAC.1